MLQAGAATGARCPGWWGSLPAEVVSISDTSSLRSRLPGSAASAVLAFAAGCLGQAEAVGVFPLGVKSMWSWMWGGGCGGRLCPRLSHLLPRRLWEGHEKTAELAGMDVGWNS